MSKIGARLEEWRSLLLDLTRRNRLLHFRETKRLTLRFEEPSAETLFKRLVVDERPLEIVGLDLEDQLMLDAELPTNVVEPKRLPHVRSGQARFSGAPEQVAKSLYTLRLRANNELEERGVGVLFVALGFLAWFEADRSDEPLQSPLLLVPVRLERRSAQDPYVIIPADDELVLNPTLEKALQEQFRIRLPAVEPAELGDLDAYLDRVRSAVSGQPRWSVQPSSYLSVFSFLKLNMYRDLELGAALAEASPVIAALAGQLQLLEEAQGDIQTIDQSELDDRVEPKDCSQVLDADSSQQAAIELAKAGASYVLQGPPGTGKSQTIANIIAEVLGQGRTVLFVSEKAAALDVVHRRLCNVGLRDFCLPLHSHKANRRDVVTELARVYSEGVSRVSQTGHDFDFDSLLDRRVRLNAYVRSLHEIHEPLGESLFGVQAALVQLRDAPDIAFSIEGVLDVSEAELRSMRDALVRLSGSSSMLTRFDDHPWRGTTVHGRSAESRRVAAEGLDNSLRDLSACVEQGAELAALVGMPKPTCTKDVEELLDLSEKLVGAPPLQSQWFRGSNLDDYRDLVATAESEHALISEEQAAVFAVFEPSVLAAPDLDILCKKLGAEYASRIRRFGSGYRADVRELAKHTISKSKPDYSQLVDLIPVAVSLQDRLARMGDKAEDLRSALGDFYLGEATDWSAALKAIDWAIGLRDALAAPLRQSFVDSVARIASDRSGLARRVDDAQHAFDDLAAALDGLRALFGASAPFRSIVDAGEFAQLDGGLQELRATVGELDDWDRLQHAHELCREVGLADAAPLLAQNPVPVEQYVPALTKRFLTLWMDSVLACSPSVRDFESLEHEHIADEFRKLDADQLEAARKRLARQIVSRRPPMAAGVLGLESSQPSLLLREAKKKRRHMPLRKLFAAMPDLLLNLKPCLMMSPLSVSQFLSADHRSVDLVIFDEASQVKPEDSIGAIMRGRQVIVVGDDRQLPPTSFFDNVVGSDEWDESLGEEQDATAFESILDICSTVGLPNRLLEWHYRSRREGLIAFSNQFLYGSRLVTFPDPGSNGGTGVEHVYVADGVYDRGRSRTNRREVQEVVRLVRQHFALAPEKSLGVVAFNEAQMTAIDVALWQLRKDHPELEPFFATSLREPLFVKNLESVQGDERDVIIFSIGFGRDPAGRLSMVFGPLNKAGGERRLNVAVSRARERVVVVSSIRGADISLASTQSEGVRLLKHYLDYAERGSRVLVDHASVNVQADPDSPFEADVADVLTRRGYRVDRQVGCSRYRIDLAVAHPQCAGEYVLGIECDGASYHSAFTTRERDRLREEVLRGLGWRLHRIWSTDWFRHRGVQIERLVAAVEQAVEDHTASGGKGALADLTAGSGETHLEELDRGEDSAGPKAGVQSDGADALGMNEHSLEPYVAASIPARTGDFHASPQSSVVKALEQVVEAEGPVRFDIAVRRVAAAWGIRRAGSQVTTIVRDAAASAVRRGLMRRDGDFLLSRQSSPVRARRNTPGGDQRKPDEVSPAEIAEAAYLALQQHLALSEEDLVTATARLLGFERTGRHVRDAIALGIGRLLRSGRAERNAQRQLIQIRRSEESALSAETGAIEALPSFLATARELIDRASNDEDSASFWRLDYLIKTFYRERESSPRALEATVMACEAQIRLSPRLAAYLRQRRGTLYSHSGYRQLAIIREKEGDYSTAIDLCRSALDQGWAGDWQKRIDRCRRKLESH